MHWTTLVLAAVIALPLIAPPVPAAGPSSEPSRAPGATRAPRADRDAGAPAVVKSDAPSKSQVREPVNVNTAGVKELMTLAGIGRSVAERIVEYRRTHGPFRTAEDVRKVEGVSAAMWERNRDRIVVK